MWRLRNRSCRPNWPRQNVCSLHKWTGPGYKLWYGRGDNWYLNWEKALSGEQVNQKFVKSICGKLNHLRCLVKDSKLRMSQIILDANQTRDLSVIVVLSEWWKSDMFWWKSVLPVFSYRTALTDPDRKPTPDALISLTYAAGGSYKSWRKRCGDDHFPGYLDCYPLLIGKSYTLFFIIF